jgi:hypothetical protein
VPRALGQRLRREAGQARDIVTRMPMVEDWLARTGWGNHTDIAQALADVAERLEARR